MNHHHHVPASLYLAVDAVCYDERGVNKISTVAFGPWELRVNVEQTRSCYQQTDEVSAEGCGCDPCRNFALTRQLAYPPEVIAFFEELGIDRWKPFELSHYSKMPSGRHLYGGWHYFCGSVENGPSGKATVHRITPTFEIELNPIEHPRQPFPDSSSVQLDFFTELPWILDAPEPE